MNTIQNIVLAAKRSTLERARSWRPEVSTSTPAEALSFIRTPAPFPNYPAPGAAAVTVLSYQCPAGQRAIVNKLAVVHVGGGFVDGSGNVIWRVLINGAAVRGLENQQSQIGSYPQPNDVIIHLLEGDILSVTVEVPAAQPPMPGTTAARFHGYTLPLVNRQ